MKLDIEEERAALARYALLKFECAQSHELFDQQQKLVAALEQLEQAREALGLVRSIIADGSATGFNCHSGDWADRLFKSQAVTSKALNQQREG